jgi:hypothetical protein
MRLQHIIIGLVAVGGVVAGWYVYQRQAPAPPRPAPQASAHGSGIDHAMASANAIYDAPEGKTACESAYLAFQAAIEAAKRESVKPIVLKTAPREEFLTKCAALPPLTQQCLVPKYLRDHRPECLPAKPAPEVLKALVELQQAEQPSAPEPPAR